MKRRSFLKLLMTPLALAVLKAGAVTLPFALAGNATATGGLLGITIADATPIDPVAGIGASGSGWVAICVLKGLTDTGQTLDASKLTIQVTDPGYDTSGNVTTVSRTITGVAHLRRQYPNGNSKMISTDGVNLTVYVTLDDWVYSGTTIVSASLSSGFYPSSVASTTSYRVNSSTIAYTKPLFGWINPQQDKSGGTFAVEGVAFHRHAQSAQQVACVKYSVNDGTTTSATVTCSAPTLSALQTRGNIAEVWKGTVDFSTLTQAAVCTVNAQVYPWLGDSSAVLDLTNDGTAWPTALPQTKLRVLNDRTGGYGGGFAYVQNSAVGGTVSAVAATARAAPFPTITAAYNALVTWNNSNKGHNDAGGATIRLMDTAGAATTISVDDAPSGAAPSTWTNVEKDPLSSAVITVSCNTFLAQFPDTIRWRNVRFLKGASTWFPSGTDTANSLVCLDNCVLDSSAGTIQIIYYAFKYYTNLSLVGGQMVLNGFVSATANIASLIGCVADSSSYTDSIYAGLTIGNSMTNPASGSGGVVKLSDGAAGRSAGDAGRIIYNNRLWQSTFDNGSARTISNGIAIVQNLYESDATAGNVVAYNTLADNDLTTCLNIIDQHNTGIGNRCSHFYSDIAAAKVVPNGIIKNASSRFNIWDDYNIKTDTFNGDGAGSVGNWAMTYQVGNIGNVSLFGSKGGVAPSNTNANPNYLGNAWLPSSEYNLKASQSLNDAQVMAMFTNFTTLPQGSPALGGNYIPVNTATYLKNRVPSGKSILKYDIAGTLRKTDGTGAAGAYEAAA